MVPTRFILVYLLIIFYLRHTLGRELLCTSKNEGKFFDKSCNWSSDQALSNGTGLCKSNLIMRNFSSVLNGRNFYLFGNSVVRHYSFNIKKFLDDDNSSNKKILNREEEKLKCGALLGVNSCTQFVNNNNSTMVKFLWMNTIGEKPDRTDPRDICSTATSTTENCLRAQFQNATKKDVLVLSSSMVNSTSYVGSDFPFSRYFTDIINSQMSYEMGHLSAHKTLDMLTNIFPGAIIWLPYPFIIAGHGTRCEEVEKVNEFIRESIESYCSDRVLYLNTYAMLKDHVHLYGDHIHHPGKLSDMVVLALFNVLI